MRPLKPAPLTVLTGNELRPSLSPDGGLVAFSWQGPADDNSSIYVQAAGSFSPPFRLTKNAANDTGPAWSPNGRQIAFYRAQPGEAGGAVFVIPALGGEERKLTDAKHAAIAWSPDGSALAVVDRNSINEP